MTQRNDSSLTQTLSDLNALQQSTQAYWKKDRHASIALLTLQVLCIATFVFCLGLASFWGEAQQPFLETIKSLSFIVSMITSIFYLKKSRLPRKIAVSISKELFAGHEQLQQLAPEDLSYAVLRDTLQTVEETASMVGVRVYHPETAQAH